jgi:hypothetical protein
MAADRSFHRFKQPADRRRTLLDGGLPQLELGVSGSERSFALLQ